MQEPERCLDVFLHELVIIVQHHGQGTLIVALTPQFEGAVDVCQHPGREQSKSSHGGEQLHVSNCQGLEFFQTAHDTGPAAQIGREKALAAREQIAAPPSLGILQVLEKPV